MSAAEGSASPQGSPRFKRAAAQVAVLTKNPWVVFTQKFILFLVGVIVAVDLFLAMNNEPGDTISEVLKNWAYRHFFVLTWTWGVLAGHLFLTSPDSVLAAPWNIWLLLGLSVALLVAGLRFGGIVTMPVQLVLLLVGTLAGYLLWPQGPVTP